MQPARDTTNTSPNLATIRDTLDRQVSELRALTRSPGERAWLAQIAMQAIVRGLGGGQP
ncbi:hypothetical protein [Acidiphilium acidophilum]|uniref:hypothetical protein n=1 Tax=Acidiphilium acidophilum TaxID=76588 RepID=UPI002E8E6AAD|nr:hypothetical protein [Acidiphilium acidophilum]